MLSTIEYEYWYAVEWKYKNILDINNGMVVFEEKALVEIYICKLYDKVTETSWLNERYSGVRELYFADELEVVLEKARMGRDSGETMRKVVPLSNMQYLKYYLRDLASFWGDSMCTGSVARWGRHDFICKVGSLRYYRNYKYQESSLELPA